jgi:hypothetical protein
MVGEEAVRSLVDNRMPLLQAYWTYLSSQNFRTKMVLRSSVC